MFGARPRCYTTFFAFRRISRFSTCRTIGYNYQVWLKINCQTYLKSDGKTGANINYTATEVQKKCISARQCILCNIFYQTNVFQKLHTSYNIFKNSRNKKQMPKNKNESGESSLFFSEEGFKKRFIASKEYMDPFGRVYAIGEDMEYKIRSVMKYYSVQNGDQEEDVLQNLNNYEKLRQVDGICKMVGYCHVTSTSEIIAAFQYNDHTLKEYIYLLQHSNPDTKLQFYCLLLTNLLKIIEETNSLGMDFDDLHLNNILIFTDTHRNHQLNVKILYDEREKKYQGILNAKQDIYWSSEKVQSLMLRDRKGQWQQKNSKGQWQQNNSKGQWQQNKDQQHDGNHSQEENTQFEDIIYQVGLLLLDVMYRCQYHQQNNPKPNTNQHQEHPSNQHYINQQQQYKQQQENELFNRDSPIKSYSLSQSSSRSAHHASNYIIITNHKACKNQSLISSKLQYLEQIFKSSTSINVKSLGAQVLALIERMLVGRESRLHFDEVCQIIAEINQRTVKSKARNTNSHQQQTNITKLVHYTASNTAIHEVRNTPMPTNTPKPTPNLIGNSYSFSQDQRTTQINALKNNNNEYNHLQTNHASNFHHSLNHNNTINHSNTINNNTSNNESSYESHNQQSISSNNNLDSLQYSNSGSFHKKHIISHSTLATDQKQKYYLPSQDDLPHSIQNFIPKRQILQDVHTHQETMKQLSNMLDSLERSHNIAKKEYFDKSTYYGEIDSISQKRSGEGLYIYYQGDIYFGTWKENHLLGGVYIFKNGESFQGTVKSGKQGWGKYFYSNGNVYEGEWKDDYKSGKGKMTYPNADVYEGMWSQGKKNGKGTYYYHNGTIYEGAFLNGRKNGFGVITFANKTKIEACWQETHIEGPGKVFYNNGDYFEGNYHQSEKQGEGLYIWEDYQYQGQFKKDTMDGIAKIHFKDKEYYHGRIRFGKRDGQGQYHYENGDYFIGEWKHDQKNHGKYHFHHGDVFQGRFKSNQISHGTMLYSNSESYEGEFQNGLRHGLGCYRDQKGNTLLQGLWNHDDFTSKS